MIFSSGSGTTLVKSFSKEYIYVLLYPLAKTYYVLYFYKNYIHLLLLFDALTDVRSYKPMNVRLRIMGKAEIEITFMINISIFIRLCVSI